MVETNSKRSSRRRKRKKEIFFKYKEEEKNVHFAVCILNERDKRKPALNGIYLY